MKKYLTFSILFLLSSFSQIASADVVSRFVFVTPVQTITPGELYKAITIQSQNSTGTASQIPETFDLDFTSTSPTGQFLASSGKPATKAMSKNTANRTVYYKDSSVGDFVLTLTATGRTSKTVFTATQHIFVATSKSQTPSVWDSSISTSISPVPATPASSHAEVPAPSKQPQQPQKQVKKELLNQTEKATILDSKKSTLESTSTESSIPETSNTGIAFEAPASKGFISSMFSWPIFLFNLIHHFFVGE